MVAVSACGYRGKSELHRARVPGESRGGAGRPASTVQIGTRSRVRATETNAAIARSEKGNPPRSNLRFGRDQVARRGRKSRAVTKATT